MKKPKTVRIEIEKPDQHLIDCHMHVNDVKHKTIRVQKHEFVMFLERITHEVYNKGSQVEDLIIRLS